MQLCVLLPLQALALGRELIVLVERAGEPVDWYVLMASAPPEAIYNFVACDSPEPGYLFLLIERSKVLLSEHHQENIQDNIFSDLTARAAFLNTYGYFKLCI